MQEEKGKLKQRRWTGIQIKEEKKGDRSELGGGGDEIEKEREG